jgi:flavin reductase (DIM6/NTAB) family NADH-FMN oxidoreductase RutF
MKQVFELGELEPADRYKLLSGLIVPRPIGWVGTRSVDGIDNLAPFSFFTMVAATPPTVLFAPGMTVRIKDTLANVLATGVFTLSVVDEDLATAMNSTSAGVDPQTDEFDLADITKVEATAVNAPMVGEARGNLECVVTHIHEVGPGPAASVVFGEVRRIHAAATILDGTRIRFPELKAVGRMAGPWFSRSTDLFAMERPDDA